MRGSGVAPLTELTVGLDGEILLGATAADPVFSAPTSSDNLLNFNLGIPFPPERVRMPSASGPTAIGPSSVSIKSIGSPLIEAQRLHQTAEPLAFEASLNQSLQIIALRMLAVKGLSFLQHPKYAS